MGETTRVIAPLPDGLSYGPDNKIRCAWCVGSEDYIHYHDREWGRPVMDDRYLFEKICLEGFQAGLSWLTVLRKREHFRRVFANFDAAAVARFTDADVSRLVQDAGIIRHRGKILSVINNVKRAIELTHEAGSLAKFFWSFSDSSLGDATTERADWASLTARTYTPVSTHISKELKKRGWSFVGPTTVYSFMQAVGMINDHVEGCFCREAVEQARRAFFGRFKKNSKD